MAGNASPSNWKLQCSDDGILWQTVHIATNQNNWTATPRQFTLSGITHFPISSIIRGRVLISGTFINIVDLTSQIKIIVKTVGYAPLKNFTVTGQFKAAIPQLTLMAFNKTLDNLSNVFTGYAGLGGRLQIDLSHYTKKDNIISEFLGKTLVRLVLSGSTPTILTNISAVIPVDVEGYGSLTTFDIIPKIEGGITNTGGLSVNFDYVTGHFVGSNSRFLIGWRTESIITNIYIRTHVRGVIQATLPSFTTFSGVGIVPLPVFITWKAFTESIILYTKLLIRINATLGLITDWPKSTHTLAVTYPAIINKYLQPTTGNIYAKTGPPVVIYFTPILASPISSIIGVGHVQLRIVGTTNTITTKLYIRVPFSTYGEFVCNLDTPNSNIQIKNWKWFKADTVNWIPDNVSCSAKGLILIGGKWKSFGNLVDNIAVYSQIFLVVPIAIKAIVNFKLSPVFSMGSIIARTLIYGKLKSTLAQFPLVFFNASTNVGRILTVTDRARITIKMLTIVHITATIPNSLLANTRWFLYGRISTSGRIQAILPDYLIGTFSLHTPIVPKPCYGLIVSTLQSINPTLLLEMRLKYGKLNTTLQDFKFPIKVFYICQGVISSNLRSLKINFDFVFHHFAGTFISSTNPPVGLIKTFSRALVLLSLNLANVKVNSLSEIIPQFHGKINLIIDAYQESSITEVNGGVFSEFSIIFKRLVYGTIVSTTKSLQYSIITGIVPRVIFGLMLAKGGQDYSRFKGSVPIMGQIISGLGRDAIRYTNIFAVQNVGRIGLNMDSLDEYRNQFIGQAAHAISGRILIEISDTRVTKPNNQFIYPLSTNIRGKVKIYGSLNAPVSGVASVYLRSANVSIGTWVGGDAQPVSNCYLVGIGPCEEEIAERLGYWPIAWDKIYWTLKWVTGDFIAQHRFPIIGILFTPDLEQDSGTHFQHTTKLHGDINGIVPFVGTMDFECQSYVEWATGFLAYAQFKGFTVKGPMAIPMRDCKGNFELSIRVYTYGKLTSDLSTVNGQFGGIHIIKGGMLLKAEKLTSSIGAKVPIPYKVNLVPITDNVTTHLQLYTPFTIFGIFQNYYLNEVTITAAFHGYMKTLVKMDLRLVESVKQLDFYIRMKYVVGVFIPTGKLDRIYCRFFGSAPEPGTYIGYTNAWFISKLSNALTSQIQLRANIYQNLALKTEVTTSAIQLLTPIRIWTYFINNLDPFSWSLTGTAWPTGRFTPILESITSDISPIYHPPILVNLSLTLNSVVINSITWVALFGTINTLLQDVKIDSNVFYGRFGYFIPNIESINSVTTGLALYPTLYLPKEPRYTVGGRVVNTQTVQRTYALSLYSRINGELLQKLPLNTQTPFDYTFGNVCSGDYFVLCKPTQTTLSGKVHVVSVQYEKENIFV